MSYQKWIHKYQYLICELNDIKKENAVYIKQFVNDFESAEKDTTKDKKSDEKKLQEKINNRVTSSPARRIYTELSKHLHPDKGGSADKFHELSRLYNEGDTIGLILVAEENNINIEKYITDELIDTFEDSCNSIDKKIENVKCSLAYQWATMEESLKPKYTKWLKENFGINKKEKD